MKAVQWKPNTTWLGRLLCRLGLHDMRIVRVYLMCFDVECSRCDAKDFDSWLTI